MWQRSAAPASGNRYQCDYLWMLWLYFSVSSFPLIFRSNTLIILSIFNLTIPFFIICPCIVPIWALGWLTPNTIINIIGIGFRRLRGIFQLILRGTAPGQLIQGEFYVYLLLLWVLTLAFFFKIAPSSVPLPPSSRCFSWGTVTSSDGEFGHSISLASFSVPSALQASPSGLEASFGMLVINSKCRVSHSLNMYKWIPAYLCSCSLFQPAHLHSLDNQVLGHISTILFHFVVSL